MVKMGNDGKSRWESDENEDLGDEFVRHGDVYRWLRANYEKVRRWREERQYGWKAIASRIGRDGVTGARGDPPTERSVWKVWQRVCRDLGVAEQRH
jgi:hypothetical protein